MTEQIPFGTPDFALNPEPRCPCVLLLDTSASMDGERMEQLNEGLVAFKNEIMADTLSSQRVEVAIVTFGEQVREICPFTTMDSFVPPFFSAGGHTPMGEAINTCIDLVEERKKFYRQQGLQYFRPWIFLITDGEPTDEWQSAAIRIKEGETAKKFAFWAVAVEDANRDILRAISVRQPVKLKELMFRELFIWLSSTLQSVSHSRPGEEGTIRLQNPAGPDGWATI